MNEQSIIVIGGNSVGKTTMIYRYLEKDENTIKPTIAIDYSFARKTGKNWTKSCIHIWEVGNLTASIIAAAISGAMSIHSVDQILLIIMVDLSKPETLWSTLEQCLSTTRNAIKIAHTDDTIDRLNKLRLNELKNSTNESSSIVDPLPYKTCIIGSKYDRFKIFEAATKKLMGQTLRQVAFTTGSHLQYYSSKDSHLVRKMKDLLSHSKSPNQNNYKKDYCCDYEQALFIPAGSESLNDIHLNNYSSTQSKSIFDVIKHVYLSEFPDNENIIAEKNVYDPTNDPNFSEPIIDKLLSQREEEIAVNLQEMMEGRLPKPIIPDPQ